MVKCKKCGTTFDGNFCPSCGAQFKKRKWLVPVVIISAVLLVGIVGGVIANTTLNNDMEAVQTFISQGKYDEAKEKLDYQLDTNSSSAKVYIAYADFYLAQNDVINAVQILEKGLKKCTATDSVQNKLDEINTSYSAEIEAYKTAQAEADRKAAEDAAKEEERKKQEAAAQQQKSKEDYLASCQTIDYQTLARNPDSYKGQSFKFTGEVIQVTEPTIGSTVTLRINVTKETILDEDFYSDTVLATVSIPDGNDRILEGDIITFYGDCEGLHTYESIFNQKISLPKISIKYYAIQ